MSPDWYCIAGIHQCEDGRVAVTWIGHERSRDTAHVFDSVIIRRTVPVVIGERINVDKRRWLPVAWPKKAEKLADKLLSCGCNMEPEPVDDSEAAMEVMSRTVREMMESERFKVARGCEGWAKEYQQFHTMDNVPGDTAPQMAATWCAMAKIEYARRKPRAHGATRNYPETAIV